MPETFLKRALRPALPFAEQVTVGILRILVDTARFLHLLPSTPPKTTQPGRFLIVYPTVFLGDTVLLLPMVERLRRAWPAARIEFAIGEGMAPLLRGIREIDHVYGLKLRTPLPGAIGLRLERIVDLTRGYLLEMKGCAPDVCIMPRWGDDLFQGNYLGYLTGARRRIGFDSRTQATPAGSARDRLLTEAYPGGYGLHEAYRGCLLLSEAGLIPAEEALSVVTAPLPSLRRIAETTDWNSLAARLGVDTETPFAVIASGASQPSHRWPNDRWAAVIRELHRLGLKVVLLGGPKDAQTADELSAMAQVPLTVAAGKTTLAEAVALLARAALFLGNDSGAGHTAAPLGTPAITLFVTTADSNPDQPCTTARVAPLGPRTVWCLPETLVPPCEDYCRAAGQHCILNVTTEQVIAAVTKALNEPGSAFAAAAKNRCL